MDLKKEVSRIAVEHYYSSNPDIVGYVERVHIWEKWNVLCKTTMIVESEVADCYKKVVSRFRGKDDER